jgi:glycosyltransferase involved in cell wall biosynthesis
MKRITFVGPVGVATGYSLHSQQLIRDVGRLGQCYVSVRPSEWNEASYGVKLPMDILEKRVHGVQPEDWELLLHTPNFVPTAGKRTAYFTMWEAENLPEKWVRMLNMAEFLMLPCQWNVDSFKASGVTKPIHKVPLGIKPEIFSYRPPQFKEHEEFVFGSAAKTGGGGKRKGLNEVIEVFQQAFPVWNPAAQHIKLKIKAFPDCEVPKAVENDTRIEITKCFFTEQQLADWYASLDCFVSLSSSEGWGLMPHQAMSVGRPVIGCIFGGQAEYMAPENSFPLHYKLVPSQFNYAGYGNWSEPDREHAIELMRFCAANPAAVSQRGLVASRSVAHLTWENSNRQVVELLKQYGAL